MILNDYLCISWCRWLVSCKCQWADFRLLQPLCIHRCLHTICSNLQKPCSGCTWWNPAIGSHLHIYISVSKQLFQTRRGPSCDEFPFSSVFSLPPCASWSRALERCPVLSMRSAEWVRIALKNEARWMREEKSAVTYEDVSNVFVWNTWSFSRT